MASELQKPEPDAIADLKPAPTPGLMPMPDGKRRLIEALLRLAGRESHAMPGLRELAREAGLNHNTFYRHFADMDALLQAAIMLFIEMLRAEVGPARAAVAPGEAPTRAVVGTVFDFATRHADAFVLAYRVLHGGPSRARDMMRLVIEVLVEDMARDFLALGLVAADAPPARLRRLLRVDILHVFGLAVRQIETPAARDALLAEAGELLMVLLASVGSKDFFF